MKSLSPALQLVLFITLTAGIILSNCYERVSAVTEIHSEEELVAYGRRVYIEEGCIHCHSQYVRPLGSDIERWGPYRDLEIILDKSPVLIGNRRQGPDLLNVGNRRSREWNKLHLMKPRELSPGSLMPSYVHLFSEGENRGDALLDYLASLGSETIIERQDFIKKWLPKTDVTNPSVEKGRNIYMRSCAQCHGETGIGNGTVASSLSGRPRDLVLQDWHFVGKNLTIEERNIELARIIKFGILGTNMPGHEYLSDADIINLLQFVSALK